MLEDTIYAGPSTTDCIEQWFESNSGVKLALYFSVRDRVSQGDGGASRLTVLIFGSLLFSVLYLGYEILPKFYRFYELENQAFGVARRAGIVTDKEIRRRLKSEIKRYEIPADPDDLEILRDDGELEINLSYDDILFIPWFEEDIELYTFEFDLHVREQYSGAKQKF